MKVTTKENRMGCTKSLERGLGLRCVLLWLWLLLGSERARGHAVAVSGDAEKTADLSLLINETLAINNKTLTHVESSQNSSGLNHEKPQFRDDWTFDRVEYDLMEFLQELNARYQYGTANKTAVSEPLAPMSDNKDDVKRLNLSSKSAPIAPETSAGPKQLDEVEQSKAVDGAPAADKMKAEAQGQSPAGSTSAPVQQLPVSLASGDHEISDSNWQYGIFDRFTRARSTKPAHVHTQSSTTPDPYLAANAADIDVRSFNSDECGLRTYLPDDYPGQNSAAMFPPADLLPLSELDSHKTNIDQDAGGEASKELNQRRQRPTTVLSKRKQQQSSADPSGPSGVAQAESGGNSYEPQEDDSNSNNNSDSELSPADSESEFNLSLRRQWLQQQLGNTLQMLGFNVSSGQSPAEFLNQTSGASLNVRENMMKKSGPIQQKASKQLASGGDNEQLLRQLDELRARQDEMKLEARVIGGTDARLGDSPWSVSLQALVSRPGTGGVEYRHYCGGTIISEYYILTAAHCLDFMVGRESRLFVVMGDLNWRMSAASMYGKRHGIEKLIIHSGYKSTAFGHDIGLVKTREPIKPLRVNGRYIVNSVCLPERNIEHSGEAELVGWGLFSNRNEMADSLQIADVPILPRPLCVDLYRRRTGLIQWLIGIELITDKQICAGTFGRGICQGDSGSALVFNEKITRTLRTPDGRASTTRLKSNLLRDQQSKATIIGVVAFGGIRRCSYQSLPGVYMQTSKYLDWILPRISA